VPDSRGIGQVRSFVPRVWVPSPSQISHENRCDLMPRPQTPSPIQACLHPALSRHRLDVNQTRE
jgi:hypothetical protein